MEARISLGSPVESIRATITIFPVDELDWDTLNELQGRFKDGVILVALAITHGKELTISIHKKGA